MPNENGSVYGLTILSPIIDRPAYPNFTHNLQIRMLPVFFAAAHHEVRFAKVIEHANLARLGG